jgi:hypothetical protein
MRAGMRRTVGVRIARIDQNNTELKRFSLLAFETSEIHNFEQAC